MEGIGRILHFLKVKFKRTSEWKRLSPQSRIEKRRANGVISILVGGHVVGARRTNLQRIEKRRVNQRTTGSILSKGGVVSIMVGGHVVQNVGAR